MTFLPNPAIIGLVPVKIEIKSDNTHSIAEVKEGDYFVVGLAVGLLQRLTLRRRGVVIFGSGHRTDWETPLFGPTRGQVMIPIPGEEEKIGKTSAGEIVSVRKLP